MILTEAILKAKILIVEDDKVSRKLLERILTSSGFVNVRSIPNAKRLSLIYKKFLPDLLILDLNLPGADGFKVMKELKKDYAEDYLPVLVISAQDDEQVHLRALASGAKDFLNKPYDRPKVLLRARNLIEVRLLYRELCHQNDELEQKVRERTKELRESRIDVIRRLGFAAEHRDNETGEHIIRMSRYCACLARALGMNDEECDLVLATTPLHDVGKIAIPDAILLKQGSLTPEEWEVMKTHPVVGAQILAGADSPFLQMAETIALRHHEKWDGSGYPGGLKGEAIPLPARICAVCDVFDALTSERPYKRAWTVEEAAKEIRKLSGHHFDPAIVDVFLAILPEIRKIKRDVDASMRGSM